MTPWLDDGDLRLYHGDVLDVLRGLPAGVAQTCVTSPPYWGLRDYGTGTWSGGDPDCDHAPRANGGPSMLQGASQRGRSDVGACRCGAQRVDDQLGLEATPDAYITRMVEVFREVRRVLRDDGTLWCNLGDSFLPGKQLAGIPWKVAFALQADGWYLRSDIIWAKPNPMPESVTDRPTKSHEYVFLFSKQPRYFYDADAVREPHTDYERGANGHRAGTIDERPEPGVRTGTLNAMDRGAQREYNPAGRNLRSVWQIATQPFPEAHFATYPEELVRRCILAGSKEGDLVLDPFIGSGTTALVARKHGRHTIGIDLSAEYLAIAARRTRQLSLLGGC